MLRVFKSLTVILISSLLILSVIFVVFVVEVAVTAPTTAPAPPNNIPPTVAFPIPPIPLDV